MGRFTWFPGHMAKALREVQQMLRRADLVVEVRDARVPFTSANGKLEQLLGNKRRIVALNKSDLADPRSSKSALAKLEAGGLRALLTSVQHPGSVEKLLRSAVDWIQAERRNSGMSVIMIVGVPNCGKSSLINALKLASKAAGTLPGEQAHQRKAVTGPTPGLTRHMASFQVCAQPQTYVLDTPGIMMPTIKSDEDALKLALTGAIKDSIVGEEAMLQFYLHLLQQPRHTQALKRAMAAAGRARDAPTVPQPADAAAQGPTGSRNTSTAIQLRRKPGGALAAAQDVRSVGPLLLAAAHANLQAGGWHPGLADEGMGERARRFELFMSSLGVTGGSDPSKQEARVRRLLLAFREGALGRYTLDDV